jgi:hypothetical protein
MDIVFRALLLTTQEPFIVPLLIAGFLVVRREAFARTTLILLLSLSINPFLKAIFEVPLPEALGKNGFALPSGHMQSAVVLWGWLALEANHRLFFAILPLLWLGIGMGLVHFGYHTPADVTAAVLSGCTILAAFYLFLKYFRLSRTQLAMICTGMSLLFYYLTPNHKDFAYLLVAPSALLGFSLGWLLIPLKDCGMPQGWAQKAGLLVFTSLGIAALYVGTRYISSSVQHTVLLYSSIGFWAGSLALWLYNKGLRLKISIRRG